MKKIVINTTGQQVADLLYANDLEAQTRRWSARAYEIDESATKIINGIEYTFRSKITNNNTEPQAIDLEGQGAAWTPIGLTPAQVMTPTGYPNVAGLEKKFVPGKNKFNGVVTEGFYLNADGGLTADLRSSFSDYQATTPGTTETVSGITYAPNPGFVVVFYDTNKNKVGQLSGPTALTHLIPTGGVYKRFNTRFVQDTPSYKTIQSEVSPVATTFEPYATSLSVPIVLPDKSVTGAKVADKTLTPENMAYFTNRLNIFDKYTMVKYGFVLNNSDGAEIASTGWAYVTIPVDPSKLNVVVSKGQSNVPTSDDTLHFFPATGAKISSSQNLTAPIPANAATLRFNISNAALNNWIAASTIVVEYGTQAGGTGYIGYNKPSQIPYAMVQKAADAAEGKIVAVFGDSIVRGTTQPNGGPTWTSWVDQLATFGIAPINRGDNGATIANVPNRSFLSGALLTSGFNLATALAVFSAGTNDWEQAVPIGTLQDTVDTTVMGSYLKAINWVKVNAPNCKILLLTPLERSTSTSNAIGLKLLDYRNAIIQVAKAANVPYVDMYYNNVISMPTAYKYLYDGLHPNDGGYTVMLDTIAPTVIKMLAA